MKRLILLGCVVFMIGCAWTGTKNVDMWGLKWENYAGMDVKAGFNNLDKIDERRGVSGWDKPHDSAVRY